VTISIDPNVLLGWYQSFYGGSGTGVGAASSGSATSSVTSIANRQYAPTPPWSQAQPSQAKLVQSAESGANIVDPSAAKLDMPGASSDYKNLFALYQGLNTLYDVASQASGSNVSSFQLSQLSSAFASGFQQVQQFVSTTSFNKLRLSTGTTAASETSTASTPQQAVSYDTAALNSTGDSSAVVPAFQGPVAFDVTVQHGSTPIIVHMDFSEMGSTSRTMANVLAYLNGKMSAAGAITTFSSNPMPAQPDVIQVGGKSVTVSDGQEQWGLQLNTDPLETVSLSAAQTDPAVYIGQVTGNQSSTVGADGTTSPPDASAQLLKFQAGGAAISSPNHPAFAVQGQLFTDSLGNAVKAVDATAAAPDGSVYVLANVTSTPSGGAPAGGQDVALLKYDSAGKLLFQQDVGSIASASGLSLAVSADGSKVAVAGDTNGALSADQTPNNTTGPNGFVAVYDSEGQQVWSHANTGVLATQANAVAFGADGSLYVAGSTLTSPGETVGPGSPSNGLVQVFSPTGAQLSSTTYGSGASQGAGVAVDGTNVYVAGVENGDAVVREYDASNPAAPVLSSVRDLGSLQGGNVLGVSVQSGVVYVAGNARGGALNNAGSVTSASTGSGLNAFAATLSPGLSPSASDKIAYYGGSGDTAATAMTVSGGEVWLTGSATGTLPGQAQIGARDGFVASLNVAAGSADYAQRFTGLDGKAAPTSIALAPSGVSVLDQLGLPQGLVDGPVTDLLTAATSLKAGDSFKIAVNGGPPTTITIEATDTMDSLATRISQATGFTVNVSASSSAGPTTLQIQPLTSDSTITLSNGPAGRDALSELGLKPGILAQTTTQNGVTKPLDGKGMIYGLGLDPTLNLGSSAAITHAMAQITAAMSVLKQAYQNLKTAATPANVLALQKAQASQGKAPAYLTSEISNYQAALNRLTGGQTSSSGLTSLFGA
jgi:hypothetical protein